MFDRIPKARTGATKRLWLIAGELIASNNPNRWPEIAKTIDLKKLRSYRDRATGETKFKYVGLILSGGINKELFPTQNTLHPFWDAMRMVAEVYNRADEIGSRIVLKRNPQSRIKPIKLSEAEMKILDCHPQYQGLVSTLAEHNFKLRLVSIGQNLYNFAQPEPEAA